MVVLGVVKEPWFSVLTGQQQARLHGRLAGVRYHPTGRLKLANHAEAVLWRFFQGAQGTTTKR